jgi:WD40 repeat protein
VNFVHLLKWLLRRIFIMILTGRLESSIKIAGNSEKAPSAWRLQFSTSGEHLAVLIGVRPSYFLDSNKSFDATDDLGLYWKSETGSCIRKYEVTTGQLLVERIFPLRNDPARVNQPIIPAFSPDLQKVAWNDEDAVQDVVFVGQWLDDGSSSIAVKCEFEKIDRLVFSQDGHHLAGVLVRASGIDVTLGILKWDLRERPSVFSYVRKSLSCIPFVLDDDEYSVAQPTRAIAIHPDGSRICLLREDKEEALLWRSTADLSALGEPWALPGAKFMRFGFLSFDREGRRLAVSSEDWIVVFDARSQAVLYSWKLHRAATDLAMHPSGRCLAAACGERSLIVFDLAEGVQSRTIECHVGPVTAVAFSPDGNRIALGSTNGVVELAPFNSVH